MGRIKLQVQLSIDGFISGTIGDQDWMLWDWDDDLRKYIPKLTQSVNTFLIGQDTYEGMSMYWPSVIVDPENMSDNSFLAQRINEATKIVFSEALQEVSWYNSILASEGINKTIRDLKIQAETDAIIYYSIGLEQIKLDLTLIDEFYFLINPAVLGKGISFFQNLQSYLHLKLIETKGFSCGMVVLIYHR